MCRWESLPFSGENEQRERVGTDVTNPRVGRMAEVKATIKGITADWKRLITCVVLRVVAGVWCRLGFHGCRRRRSRLLLVGLCPVLTALHLILLFLLLKLASLCLLLSVLLTLGVHHLPHRDSVSHRPRDFQSLVYTGPVRHTPALRCVGSGGPGPSAPSLRPRRQRERPPQGAGPPQHPGRETAGCLGSETEEKDAEKEV